jgi:cell surface protein SprA
MPGKCIKTTLFVLFLYLGAGGFFSQPTRAAGLIEESMWIQQVDSPEVDLPFPLSDQIDPFTGSSSRIDLDDPENVTTTVEFDPVTGQYILVKKIGEYYFRYPMAMSMEEYLQYDMEQSISDYWDEKFESESLDEVTPWTPSLNVGGGGFDRIFGGNKIDIRPQGSAEITLGVNVSKTENPRIPVNQRRITTFDFDQRIQLNVIGNIGEKLKLTTSYNTEATFDFENQMKLEYTGYEDEIIKELEAGNVSLALPTTLISGVQSLFGVRSELQFGKLYVTSLISQQKGERKEINVEGGAQTEIFEITADQYEENRHYFLSNYFRDEYDRIMQSMPNPATDLDITRVEVWVVNTQNNFENFRNVIAFSDIGESEQYLSGTYKNSRGPEPTGNPIQSFPTGYEWPDNNQNILYQQMFNDPGVRAFDDASNLLIQNYGYQPGIHFEKVTNARRLDETDYTFNRRAGFISLRQSLNNDEVLAVAYQYTKAGVTYQVGEFSTDGVDAPQPLYLKLLKSTITNVRAILWDQMMKNVYNIGAFQVSSENFSLNIIYTNPLNGVDIPYVPYAPVEDVPLNQVIGLDRYNLNGEKVPDGVFDFFSGAESNGGTINTTNGRVFLTTVEPFGRTLDKALIGPDPNNPATDDITRSRVVYQPLYDSTKTIAQQFPELNRFKLIGEFQSSSGAEISLNAVNVPEGSVIVTAGGVRLVENQDYTVDYNLGRVKIINDGLLESRVPIKIQLESNSLFNIQTKTLLASRFEYRFSKDFNLGGTVMNLSERPITNKVNVGDDPINNTMVGLDGNYFTESGFITRMVDAIPGISTTETSTLSFSGEVAKLFPGHSRAVRNEGGTSYIDDFEGSQSQIDLRSFIAWNLASTPQGQPFDFPESTLSNDLRIGYNRARFSWYTIDPLFFRNSSITPGSITNEVKSNHFMREVLENEVFPNKELETGAQQFVSTFDLAFYPSERGQYNYDKPTGLAGISLGFNPDGTLQNPETRWGGTMRNLTTTDFEAANIEIIEFWLMDPYNVDSPYSDEDDPTEDIYGDLFINLGNVSEDVLRDSRRSFENGLPRSPDDVSATTVETVWGVIPTVQTVVNAFDNTTNSNAFQDIGLDGLNDVREAEFFSDYLTEINNSNLTQEAKNAFAADLSADNYHHFRGSDYDAQELNTLERYKEFNGLEGNSITAADSPESYPTSATTLPSTEDINNDNNLNETESYFQYKISMKPEDLYDENGVPRVGHNHISDFVLASPTIADGSSKPVYWIQFKVDISDAEKVVNGIADFRSIRFFRMYAKGFNKPFFARFARLNLVRAEWRRYNAIREEGPIFDPPTNETTFYTAAVNTNENSNRQPINYVIPPGIQQQLDVGSANLRALNEQSLVLGVDNLEDGESRAVFRDFQLDMRSYNKLRMFVHVEKLNENQNIDFGDVSCFIRLGTDFEENYYEYEIPLVPSEWFNNTIENIWPEGNNIVVDFKKLQEIKNRRNQLGLPSFISLSEVEGNSRITVKGNPTLSAVRTIMIGIKNPSKDGEFANPWTDDDGEPVSVEMWVNELRLTDFEEQGGWAATGRIDAKLADLGQVSLAGTYSTPDFGSIEQRINDRSRETSRQLDFAGNFKLGKFFPENWGIQIPFYYGLSITQITPKWDPLAPDILFSDATENLNQDELDERKREIEDFTRRRSLNFTNVRKNRSADKKKTYPWDIENLALSFSHNKLDHRDFNIEYDNNFNWKTGLTYIYNPKELQWKPFSKTKIFRTSKWLRLIKDFNIGLIPKQLTFRSDLNRAYTERLLRVNADLGVDIPQIPQFTKSFTWTRDYNFKYDFSRNLRFDYSATNVSFIREQEGRIDKNDESWNAYRDTIWNSILDFGDNQTFNQRIGVNYTIPLDKLPLTDWISATAGYNASYEWVRAPLSQDTLGNTIQNSNNISLNGQINMLNLYNKVGYLKKINKKYSNTGRRRSASRARSPNEKEDSESEEKKKKEGNFSVVDTFFRIVMMLKNISGTYAQTNGTALPGYNQFTRNFGMNSDFNAPGWEFILGQQSGFGETGDFADYAASNDWLVQQPLLNNRYLKTRSEQLNFRANIEPIPHMRLEITMQRSRSSSESSFYRWVYDDPDNPVQDEGRFENQSPLTTGTISYSVTTINTAFSTPDENYRSEVYDQFLRNRPDASRRLGEESDFDLSIVDSTGYYEGYGKTQQQVVITSFISAYSKRDVSSLPAQLVNSFPSVNWRVTYDGFMKSDWFRKVFKTFTISHAYRSTLNASYQSNLLAGQENGDPNLDVNGNIISTETINSITISEQFAPLVNVDMQWKNSLITKVEFGRDRSITLNMSNLQVLTVTGQSYVFGLGYRLNDVKLPFKFGNKTIRSDLTLRGDLTIRNNTTVTHQEAEVPVDGVISQNTLTAGNRNVSIKVAADYVINRRLNVRFFYDQQLITPLISTSFPTSNISTGLSLRFTLSQ